MEPPISGHSRYFDVFLHSKNYIYISTSYSTLCGKIEFFVVSIQDGSALPAACAQKSTEKGKGQQIFGKKTGLRG
ncbi:hypothetical protein [Paraperlucidibaca sp.]|uniref:hypothetical protein n=1 Tax=Paraperlucidibaca sp. TaxID=2708021 RepID=UPI0030F3F2FE